MELKLVIKPLAGLVNSGAAGMGAWKCSVRVVLQPLQLPAASRALTCQNQVFLVNAGLGR